jgi:hypothetical protein
MMTMKLSYIAFVLPVVVVVLVRRLLGGPPVFRMEFLIEDFLFLLALSCAFVPASGSLLRAGAFIALCVG